MANSKHLWFSVSIILILSVVLAIVLTSSKNTFPRNSVIGISNGLELTLKLEAESIRIGDQMNLTLKLRNISPHNITLKYGDSHVMEVYLYDQNLRLVTFLGKGCAWLQVITNIRLEPREYKEWHISWTTMWKEDIIKPGRYLFQGEILRAVRTQFLPISILPDET
ncbi:hypothetical protein HXY33_04820 [Candidatus Bathyarchaeota archaeon]|nr:hypothetical protein [Candidatus Bathyarchaeota archaeon]